jgi:hypothetical protein
MAMGQRHAVAAAQSATNVLTGFTMPKGVTVQSCIDNVRFVGPKDAVLNAATTLTKRCRACGVTVNELPSSNSEKDDEQQLEKLLHQEGDWLGATYNYRDSSQRVAQKTLDKLKVSFGNRAEWTHRTYAAHMGLLFFASGILHAPIASYFEALKQLRRRSAELTARPEQWEEAVRITPSEGDALKRWTEFSLRNTAVPCATEERASRVLITDASDWGWGALFFDYASGAALSFGTPWTAEDRMTFDTNRSTYAEPEAIYRALCRFIKPWDSRPLLVLTDSSTAKYSLARGYSAAFPVNDVARRVKQHFPRLILEFEHVPGANNPADGLSRGLDAELAPAQVATAAQQAIQSAGAESRVAAVKGGVFPH